MMGNHEIREESLTVLIGDTPHAFSFGNAGENEMSQRIGISLCHSQC